MATVWVGIDTGGTLTEALGATKKGADSPEIVSPLMMQVARARTRPKLAGMFGSTHVPLGRTRVLRFNTLTMQFSLSRGPSCGSVEVVAAATAAKAAVKNVRSPG